MALESSQGKTFAGITGLTSISRKSVSVTHDPSKYLVDVSTLAIANLGDRVYDSSPLIDKGPGITGNVVTVTVSYYVDTAIPAIGDTVVDNGDDLICIEVNQDWKVGEYSTGTATYVSYDPLLV